MKLPHRPLTDADLLKYVKLLKIPHVRCIFMRNALPKGGQRKYESAIVNLGNQIGPATHWIAFTKEENEVIYFASFGNFRPSLDLFKDFGVGSIKYNHERYQNYNTFVCVHLCLKFLCNQLKSKSITLYISTEICNFNSVKC